jgi:hypothetical protein
MGPPETKGPRRLTRKRAELVVGETAKQTTKTMPAPDTAQSGRPKSKRRKLNDIPIRREMRPRRSADFSGSPGRLASFFSLFRSLARLSSAHELGGGGGGQSSGKAAAVPNWQHSNSELAIE